MNIIVSYQMLIICFENYRIVSNFDNLAWKLSYLIDFFITYIENYCIIFLFYCQVNVKIQSFSNQIIKIWYGTIIFKTNYQNLIQYDNVQNKLSKFNTIQHDTIKFKANYQNSIRYDNLQVKLSKFDTIRYQETIISWIDIIW